jgi:hypothetical protein
MEIKRAKGLERAAILAEQVRYMVMLLRREMEGETDMALQVLAVAVEEKAEELEACVDAECAKADKRRK